MFCTHVLHRICSKNVAEGIVSVGKIHIAAGKPFPMTCQQPADFRRLVRQVQLAQQSQIYVSDYHISATARLCNIDESIVRVALEELGCPFWPAVNDEGFQTRTPILPKDENTVCSVVLQCSHLLAPLFVGEQKKWSLWLNCNISENQRKTELTQNSLSIYDTFRNYFIAAEKLVDTAIREIDRRGYQHPNDLYILQVAAALNDEQVPRLFIRAAISMRQTAFTQGESNESLPMEALQSLSLIHI